MALIGSDGSDWPATDRYIIERAVYNRESRRAEPAGRVVQARLRTRGESGRDDADREAESREGVCRQRQGIAHTTFKKWDNE